MLTCACLRRWKYFRATIASVRTSISRAIDFYVISTAFLCWVQSALFQAAARDILADAALRSVQELRIARNVSGINALAASAMTAWRRVCCDFADMRSRASVLHAIVLQRRVASSFCQWSRNSTRITRTRALLQAFAAAACDRKMLKVVAEWSFQTRRSKGFAEGVLICRERSRVLLMKFCFGSLKSHLAFRRKMKATTRSVFALMQQLSFSLQRTVIAEWRKRTKESFFATIRVMVQGWVACAIGCCLSLMQLLQLAKRCCERELSQGVEGELKTRHMLHVKRHTSYVTRHTLHVTYHASRVTGQCRCNAIKSHGVDFASVLAGMEAPGIQSTQGSSSTCFVFFI
jgi:hypothetical protein